MIRLQCPKCRSVVTVEASRVGDLARCPHCAQPFRVPAAPAPGPPAAPAPVPADNGILPASALGGGDKNPATYDLVAEQGPRAPVSLPIEEGIGGAEEEVADDGEERPRRPRRGRLRPGIDLPEPEPPPPQTLLPGVSNFAALLMVVASLWLLAGSIALLQHQLAFLPVGLGGLLVVAGILWFLTVAFREDAVSGILCLVLPFYALYFLYRSPAEAGRPFLLVLIGGLILASGLALGGLG